MYEWAGCCRKANCADVVRLEFSVMDQLAGNAACVGQTLHETNTLVRLPTDVYKYNTHTHTCSRFSEYGAGNKEAILCALTLKKYSESKKSPESNIPYIIDLPVEDHIHLLHNHTTYSESVILFSSC